MPNFLSRIILGLFLTFIITLNAEAQVFIPFSYWRAIPISLVISDAATFNFGNININTTEEKTFTVTNTGAASASSITGAAFSGTRFAFKGGSFPGTGGTCGTSLAPTSSCTIVVTALSATAATFNDTVTLTYQYPTTILSASRPIRATFVSNPVKLAWINTPDFLKINDCVQVTVQAQDSYGNPMTVAANTTVSLTINNATNTNFYTTNTCGTTTTSRTITTGNSSVSFYVRSTTANQSAIFVGSSTTLLSASQNVLITNPPTRLLLITPPRAKTNTCTAVTVYTTDANGYYSTVGANVTVNLTTSGANTYFSNAGCTTGITSTVVATNTYEQTFYTLDATIQTVTMTATDNAAVLTTSNDTTNFATSLTWWDASWTKRIRIDINNLDQATTFTNQAVLVTLDSTRISYANFKALGADVRFVASDDVTVLNHETEKWDTSADSQIWVRVPTVTASSFGNYIYMYFDNPAANDAQNKNGVWTNYWSVWHLNENPSGTAPQFQDSTSSNRHGTAVSSPAAIPGVIGNAVDLPGGADYVDINSDLSVAIGASSTFSCWMKTFQVGDNTMWAAPGLTGIEQAGGGNDIFFGWLDATGRIGVTAGNGADAKSNFTVNNNAWRHVTISRNSGSGQVKFYINGVLQNTATSETGNKTLYFDLLGEVMDTGGSPENYDGAIDEVRIYNSVQTDAQVLADFKYMRDTHLLYNSTETFP